MIDKKVVVELCRSNSLGSNFHAASVIEQISCTQEEAEEYLKKEMANGYFFRIVED